MNEFFIKEKLGGTKKKLKSNNNNNQKNGHFDFVRGQEFENK
jgi:hypothetical protein